MDKCVGCQFYDRQVGKQTDARGVQWGQCRRFGAMLHPINQKSYMIEGVWPHVRDDDWCGEWKAATRALNRAFPKASAADSLLPASSASPFAPKPSVASLQSGKSFGSIPIGGTLASSGRGD